MIPPQFQERSVKPHSQSFSVVGSQGHQRAEGPNSTTETSTQFTQSRPERNSIGGRGSYRGGRGGHHASQSHHFNHSSHGAPNTATAPGQQFHAQAPPHQQPFMLSGHTYRGYSRGGSRGQTSPARAGYHNSYQQPIYSSQQYQMPQYFYEYNGVPHTEEPPKDFYQKDYLVDLLAQITKQMFVNLVPLHIL